jgi:hypothetical protein
MVSAWQKSDGDPSPPAPPFVTCIKNLNQSSILKEF